MLPPPQCKVWTDCLTDKSGCGKEFVSRLFSTEMSIGLEAQSLKFEKKVLLIENITFHGVKYFAGIFCNWYTLVLITDTKTMWV